MKKKLLFTSVFFLLVTVVMETFYRMNDTYSNPDGAPAGYCSNTNDCSSCHGKARTKEGWITSNIGPNGYVPGLTYTITATATYTGRNRFGFEISPQNASKAVLGTLILSNASQTKLISSGKYITHTRAGNSGSNTKTWTFNWKAPAKGTGAVTFYGSFIAANGNGKDDQGDSTYNSKLMVNEDISTGMVKDEASVDAVEVFPNPVTDAVNIRYLLAAAAKIEMNLLDVQGKVVERILSEVKPAGEHRHLFRIKPSHPSGNYFIQISTNQHVFSKKIIIR